LYTQAPSQISRSNIPIFGRMDKVALQCNTPTIPSLTKRIRKYIVEMVQKTDQAILQDEKTIHGYAWKREHTSPSVKAKGAENEVSKTTSPDDTSYAVEVDKLHPIHNIGGISKTWSSISFPNSSMAKKANLVSKQAPEQTHRLHRPKARALWYKDSAP
jgi:hypothetical protein